MRLFALLVGAIVGLGVGYTVGAFVACYWLWPESNLCGLVGVFVGAPAGLIAGMVVGWLLSRPAPP
jgi:hypothetical protein